MLSITKWKKTSLLKFIIQLPWKPLINNGHFFIIQGPSNGSVINLAVSEFGILVYQRAMYKLTEGFFGNCDSFPDINFSFILLLTPVLFLAFSAIHDPLLINKCLNPKIPLSVCRYIINKH